jgi:hypothetical protein
MLSLDCKSIQNLEEKLDNYGKYYEKRLLRDTILVHLIVVGPMTCVLKIGYYKVHPTNE